MIIIWFRGEENWRTPRKNLFEQKKEPPGNLDPYFSSSNETDPSQVGGRRAIWGQNHLVHERAKHSRLKPRYAMTYRYGYNALLEKLREVKSQLMYKTSTVDHLRVNWSATFPNIHLIVSSSYGNRPTHGQRLCTLTSAVGSVFSLSLCKLSPTQYCFPIHWDTKNI